MSGIGTALAAFGTLKAAYELVRDLRKSNDPAVLKAGIEELTDRLLSAREDALRFVEELEILREENTTLKTQLTKSENFSKLAENFERAETGFRGHVYREKNPSGGASPDYCAHCFDNNRLSILQPFENRVFKCPECKSTTKI